MIKVKQLNIPKSAGVYLFKKAGVPLYVGKAANLKKRLVSYFRKNAGDKVRRLVQEATKLEWLETESEIEALLKEAELIKKYQPKYNILMRDDKNYFYAGITREEFPRVFVTHQPNISRSKKQEVRSKRGRNVLNSRFLILDSRYIGPFTSGGALKETLRLLRRVFPYCTCRKPHKRPCLNVQIGRCLGCCCVSQNVTTIKRPLGSCNIQYRENIKKITEILRGGSKRLFRSMRAEMKHAAAGQRFEQAARLRDQIAGLENIFLHHQLLEVRLPRGSWTSTAARWHKIKQILQSILGVKNEISRVEGYDISNLSGTEATGSMAVFVDGVPIKSEYRKFKIKTAGPVRSPVRPHGQADAERRLTSNGVKGANDVAMHEEILRRRLKHTEWQYPDLILIDGGRPQLNAAHAVITNQSQIDGSRTFANKNSHTIRGVVVAALAKREEELYTEKKKQPIRLSVLPRETALFLQRVRDESHRFAKKYHHKRREILYRAE